MFTAQLLFLVLLVISCTLMVQGLNALDEQAEGGAGGQQHVVGYGSFNNGPHGK
ncbi:Protein CBG26990 [Caenorhabditis briggsae]|uniref:Protein CBG26990 n=1 Tax=Caenorhabditis briggsae TaxID=6238 RepID=B6IEV6_CAEBR|nr:Protein CBG26990 [Caenorhabditis briggsae]CAR98436.1 Protein CBG26990 [Caenorhabditis briggsae]